MRMLKFVIVVALALVYGSAAQAKDAPSPGELVKQAKRIVFLGDSITAGGRYVAAFDAWIATQRWERSPQVINLGLASETVSGLSEEGHAGGAFPRPDLAERLQRVLKLTKPDLVFACYGMNCGIYEPFDEARFEAYQQGIERLKEAVEGSGAQLILITPPFYDAQKHPDKQFYNGVLGKYSEWLLAQRKAGWNVIDLHGPMTREVGKRRQDDPKFTLAPDGVHPNDQGHWLIAQQLIAACGDAPSAQAASVEQLLEQRGVSSEVWKLVQRRMALVRDSYVAAAGHKRPGVAKGLPVDEAEAQRAELTQQIQAHLSR